MARKHKKIVEGMTDEERYEILKDRVLTVIPCCPEKLGEIGVDLQSLEAQYTTKAQKIVRTIVDQFGLKKEYFNSDIELDFNASNRTFTESVDKQKGDKPKADYSNFAKMLTCFDGVIENAIGLEVHHDRVGDDPSLKNMFVLISGFRDESSIIPVKLEVKELLQKANKLYLAVALCPIGMKKAAIPAQIDHSGSSYATAASIRNTPDKISISQLAEKINPLDGNFLKYFPDRMLNDTQIGEKLNAIKEEKDSIMRKKLKHQLETGSGTPVPKQAKAPSTTTTPKNQKTQEKISGHGKKPWHWGMD